jgi:hypothetical protein
MLGAGNLMAAGKQPIIFNAVTHSTTYSSGTTAGACPSATPTIVGNLLVIESRMQKYNDTNAPSWSNSLTVGGVTATYGGTKRYATSVGGNWSDWIGLWYLLNPPKGAQTVARGLNGYNEQLHTFDFSNVKGVGSVVGLADQTGTSISESATSTAIQNLYFNVIKMYPNAATGFTGYNQTAIQQASDRIFGYAKGNGGTLTFSATANGTLYGWAEMILPILG